MESKQGQFAHEEVQSSYAYPEGHRVKGVTEQISILRHLFPGIGFADEEIAEQPLPPDAEGWFAIPRWQKIGTTYNRALNGVFQVLSQTRGGQFHDYCYGNTSTCYLRRHGRTVAMLDKLGANQEGHDILTVPAQFGLRHRGRSVRRVREVLSNSEFGLGAFEVGIMLLTHPERLQQQNDLWVFCLGDEYCEPDCGDHSSQALVFAFGHDRQEFGSYWVGETYDISGSVTGFLPL